MRIRGLLFFLVLCLALGRISGKVFKTLDDLKEQTDFGKQNPRQGLEFLCWLLNQAKMDQNGNLRLNFDPTEKRFSFHQYKNYDLTFPDLSNTNYMYVSLGNICFKNARNQLPGYFIEIFRASQNHPQRNIDRLVIRLRKDNPLLVDKVFITQHHESETSGSDYDQNHTHEISKELLKIIAELCKSEEDDRDRNPDRNEPDDERFRKIKSMFSKASYQHWFLYRVNYKPDKNVKEHTTSNSPDNTMLKLKPTPDGRVRIEWDWIPKEMLEREMKMCVYQNKDAAKPLFECPLDGKWCGETDIDLPFNADLELRLEPITIFDTSENHEKDQTAPEFFTFSYLLSLVLYPFSSLLSLVLYPFSTLLSLVLYIFSTLLSLVLYIFSTLFSLVLYIVSILYSLVFYPFSSLNSLLISIMVIVVVRYALTEFRPEPDIVRVSHGRPGF